VTQIHDFCIFLSLLEKLLQLKHILLKVLSFFLSGNVVSRNRVLDHSQELSLLEEFSAEFLDLLALSLVVFLDDFHLELLLLLGLSQLIFQSCRCDSFIRGILRHLHRQLILQTLVFSMELKVLFLHLLHIFNQLVVHGQIFPESLRLDDLANGHKIKFFLGRLSGLVAKDLVDEGLVFFTGILFSLCGILGCLNFLHILLGEFDGLPWSIAAILSSHRAKGSVEPLSIGEHGHGIIDNIISFNL